MTGTRHATRVMQSPFARIGLPRLRRGGSREGTAEMAFTIALLWIVVLGIVPMVIAMVIGLAQGTIAEDVATPAPWYPAFPVLSPGLIVPASLLMFILTVNLPLRTTGVLRRHEIAWLAFIASGVAMTSLILDNVDAWWYQLPVVLAIAVDLLLIVLVTVRWALGRLHLVPRSWREAPAKPKRKRRS